jgi:hypothetical protein
MASQNLDIGEVLAIDETVQRTTSSPGFGVTTTGFVPKPFARLLAEKLALAQSLLGEDIDLTSGSVLRKILEVSALEDARVWAALAATYDDQFIVSARGEALSRLGTDLGVNRPYQQAAGKVKLTMTANLPAGTLSLTIPRGARMLTSGGHSVALQETAVFTNAEKVREPAVAAFYPGPDHNLDPAFNPGDGTTPQKIDRWHPDDVALNALKSLSSNLSLVTIEHTAPLTGGELRWPDERYRRMLLRCPRSIWTVEAIEFAVSQVPGVRQVKVQDMRGGLDIDQSIFGNFNFIERLFASSRDLANPYYFSVLVAPTPDAIWDGPDGLNLAVQSVLEDLRPISIFPDVQKANEVGVALLGELVVKGVPLPSGSRATVNNSQAARELIQRIFARLVRYIDDLPFGEPVRAAEITWAIMNEPGIVDVRNLVLLRCPPNFTAMDFSQGVPTVAQRFANGQNVPMGADEIPVFVDVVGLEIV